MPAEPVTLEVAYTYVEQFEQFVVSIQDYYSLFSWEEAPLHEIVYPLSTGVIYTLLVLLWATCREKPYPPGSAEAKHVAMELKQTDNALKPFVAIHNLNLCLGSLAMMVGTIYEVWMRSAREGSFHWFFCESSSTKAVGPLFFWSYVYYLSKYYELLDTVLQMMRGRPPPHFALHVYHHGCVLMMAWAWCEYQQTLQFGGLIFNTAVHVVMYLYFFLRVVSGPPWWKPLVTKFQIVQFMTSVLCFCYTAYLIFGLKEPCHGQGALACNLAFNVTLLYQFFGVSSTNAKASKAAGTGKKDGRPKAKSKKAD